MTNGQARLWQLPSSHYSEKVRWALEHKRIAHRRRTPLVVPHFVVARVLTRGETRTFPVVELPGGEIVGDSTAIIAALERAFPDPPLYPSDPAQRERALALEEWFDERLGPPVRILALGEVTQDPPRLHQLSQRHIPAPFRPFPGLWAKGFAAGVRARYGVGRPGALDEARAAVGRAFDHLERELAGGRYLVGDAFRVADLSAASHFYWLLQPAEGPHIVDCLPRRLAEFMTRFEDRDGFRWVHETYRRHRLAGADAREPLAATA